MAVCKWQFVEFWKKTVCPSVYADVGGKTLILFEPVPETYPRLKEDLPAGSSPLDRIPGRSTWANAENARRSECASVEQQKQKSHGRQVASRKMPEGGRLRLPESGPDSSTEMKNKSWVWPHPLRSSPRFMAQPSRNKMGSGWCPERRWGRA